ncbi:helix-turn-helix transcriptional regulator [Polaromonas sp. C04]|uniref:helix-turn-helix transcriptional regulator n=1 Tax=Polaromonas sp. C04 TaxID=1945857 RepID=UPI0009845167|nr:helix-turn-helix transcriptional regulator [Polaromonas sp. C04]OOG50697.1 hypothetical protein B0E49_18410 [Polaromonas sp. C04]
MDEFGELLLAIYRGAREIPLQDFQEFALDHVKTIVHFDMARWGVSVQDSRGVDYHHPCVLNDPPEALQIYAEIRDQDISPRQVLDHPGRAFNYHLTALSSVDRSTSGIFAYARRFRHEHALIVGFKSPDTGLVKSVSLYGAYTNRPFTEVQRTFIQAVVPHLMEAWTINHAVHLEKMRALFGEKAWSMAIADGAGHLLFTEDDFESLLCSEWPASRHLTVPGPLYDAVTGRDTRSWYEGRALVVVATPIKGFLFLRGRRRLPVDSLKPRERQVARQIAQGLTHKEIARQLNIAPATVRNHMQSMLERSHVRNNAELVAQLKSAGY